MTNFQLVARFNDLVGNAKGDITQPIDGDSILKQACLIDEEWNELEEALRSRDMSAIRKELCDVLVTVYGLAHILGVDPDQDMKRVSDSNMSKFCRDQDDIIDNHKHFYSLGVDVEFVGEFPHVAVISTTDQVGADGKRYPKGKALKPTTYKNAVFE